MTLAERKYPPRSHRWTGPSVASPCACTGITSGLWPDDWSNPRLLCGSQTVPNPPRR